ncbi:hypothetical protein RFI_11030 [Reticulomyxa filosa]|uniref:Uncharacterized protein n=1 Tax=Reticulomyxa filosa TaxID=46433 RepID=X6NL41_RETFI|nr:hypothetical protein RFI_11030 [Reticulomyxa filosa]|eukprot:ETO26107.1 hypothetical protein RFI_11030 [Reticulomyxa filosa]
MILLSINIFNISCFSYYYNPDFMIFATNFQKKDKKRINIFERISKNEKNIKGFSWFLLLLKYKYISEFSSIGMYYFKRDFDKYLFFMNTYEYKNMIITIKLDKKKNNK